MRKASIAMSCVADEKATVTAKTTSHQRSLCGSHSDIASRPSAMPDCASSIQERRRPSHAVSSGKPTRSTIGDQTNLVE